MKRVGAEFPQTPMPRLLRVMPVTLWPSVHNARTSGKPIAPVAPATNIFMTIFGGSRLVTVALILTSSFISASLSLALPKGRQRRTDTCGPYDPVDSAKMH